jgi:SAM-dependent methyltransferase
MSQPDVAGLDKCRAAALLTGPARQVHQWVLAEFARTGRAPARRDLARIARDQQADPDAVLAELAELDVMAFGADGQIRAAYPFSAEPTLIRVSWAAGPAAYAMCAIDALGMSAMLGHPVSITAAEPGSDQIITADVAGHEARWIPRTAVVFAGSAGADCRTSADRTCGYINFFGSAQAARRWASRHPEVTGRTMTRQGALDCGVAEFGAMLEGGPYAAGPARSDTAQSPRRPVFGRVFPHLSHVLETGGVGARRAPWLAGLSGQVIDIGAGTGASFPHFPPAVTGVTAVEPQPRLRRIAAAAARTAPVAVTVTGGMADALPAADASCDAAVVSFVLCSVPDQDRALREIRRVLRPGGRLYFLEHVRADSTGQARVQSALDATVWPRLLGGCHLGRDTTAAIERAGFRIDRLDRFEFPEVHSPVSFHIVGHASRDRGDQPAG